MGIESELTNIQSLTPEPMAGVNTHELILKSIETNKGVVLDIGAGEGALSRRLAERGFKVIASDINSNKFKMKNNIVFFVRADMNFSFPFKDAFFDFVFAVEVIEHIENPRHFMKEIFRILKKNGTLILTTPNIMSIASILSYIFRGSFIYFTEREYKNNRHITPLRLADIKNICDEVGLKIKMVDYNVGKLPIPKINHMFPLKQKIFRNRLLGESVIIWAEKIDKK